MDKKVLIVDDVMLNREMLAEILETNYSVEKAKNGREALNLIEASPASFSLIMLDLIMPVMDGFDVLERLKKLDLLKRIPIIIITSDNSVESERKCFDYGVCDFIKKPFDDALVLLRVNNAIALYSYKNNLEDKVKEQTSILSKQNKKLKEQASQLSASNQKIIEVLGTVVESRNFESGQHIQRVKKYTYILAKQIMKDFPQYRLTNDIIQIMVPASALHDVGKISISDSILLKPGRLTPEEFDEMKKHTTKGVNILKNIEGVWDEKFAKMCIDICKYHHERYDGKGYPEGLKGEEIPIAAQIVAIADVYDALVNKRVYKDAYPASTAFAMIINGECGSFSNNVLQSFTRARKSFENVLNEIPYSE